MVAVAGLAMSAIAARVAVSPPMYVQVYLRVGGSMVAGQLTSYDATDAAIKTTKEERTIAWVDMTGASAFTLRSRLIDKTKASDWLELGEMGWGMNVKQARYALNKAASMDPALKPKVDAILASEPGALVKDKAAEAVDAPDAGGAGDAAPAVEGAFAAGTPAENAAAIEKYRADATEVAGKLKVRLDEIQTDHFLIFTDWDQREYAFLKTNLEGAYAVVSRQFDLSAKENIFIGKLPVYMFARQSTFRQFAKEIDDAPPYMATMASGYYYSRDDGIGHMAMWKPDPTDTNGDVRKAERRWAYVLTHEFTHAFIARYRGHGRIPVWLNEGIAEMIAAGQFPRSDPIVMAQRMAKSKMDISPVFDDDMSKAGASYPIMRTLVEMLAGDNPRAFKAMVDDIKGGMDGEDALEKHFHCDYTGLTMAWRTWLGQVKVQYAPE